MRRPFFLLTLLAVGLLLNKGPKGPHGGGDGPENPDGTPGHPKGDGDGDGTPAKKYGDVDATSSVSGAHEAIAGKVEAGRPKDSDGDGQPDVGTRPVEGPAAHTPPGEISKRHFLDKIKIKMNRENENTVVLPGTDTARDIQGIANGEATWNPNTNRYEINGRTYGMEPNGTVFPDSGPGFVKLTKQQYIILQHMMDTGSVDGAYQRTYRNPSLNNENDFNAALEVFKHSKKYQEGGGQ